MIISVFIYLIILIIATVAALFSINVANALWSKLADIPPSSALLESIVLISVVLIPIVFILVTAFIVSYFLLAFFHRPGMGKQKRIVVIGTRLTVASVYAYSMLCILPSLVFIWRYYEHMAINPPAPYPGTVVKAEPLKDLASVLGFPDSNITSMIYVYSIQMPLDEIEEYYAVEMVEQCGTYWKFVETDCMGFSMCRQAECDISHPLESLMRDAKHFKVTLHSTSPTETKVVYTVATRDPTEEWFPEIHWEE